MAAAHRHRAGPAGLQAPIRRSPRQPGPPNAVALFPFSMASAPISILRCSGSILLPSIMNVGMCVFDVIFNFIFIYRPGTSAASTSEEPASASGRGSGRRRPAWRDPSSGHHLPQGRSARETRPGATKPCMNNMLRLSRPLPWAHGPFLAQIVMTSVVAGMGTVAVASSYVAVQTRASAIFRLRRRLCATTLVARASEPGGWIWQSGSPTGPRS
ncbi:MAG: hypothetical protein ACLU8D_06000 [Enterocloster sp.]